MPGNSQNGLLAHIAILLAVICLLGLGPQFSPELIQARQAAQAGSFLVASTHMVSAARRLPWRGDLWELAGHYALQAGDPRAAIQHLEQARQTSFFTPKSGRYDSQDAFQSAISTQGLMELGDAYKLVGDLPSAVHAWQQATASAAPSVEVSQRFLQAHLAMGDYSAATADLQTLVDLQPGAAGLRFQLGLLLVTQQPQQAMEQFQKAAELEPELAQAVTKILGSLLELQGKQDPAYILLKIGRDLASLGRWDLAVEAFQQATTAAPQYAEAWAYLGEARQHLDPGTNSEDGLYELQKGQQLNPQSLVANTLLAYYWLRHERYDLALQLIEASIRLEPQNPALQAERGNIQAASGDVNAAYEAYRLAIETAPQDPTYWRYLVDFSLRYGYQVAQVALPAARQAVILAPADPRNLDSMAQVLIRLGDLANARRYLQRALQADSNYIPAHLHLGLVHLFQGEQAAAYQELNLVRSLAPGSIFAEQARRLLETYFPGVKLP